MKDKNHKTVQGESRKQIIKKDHIIGKWILVSGLGSFLIGIAVGKSNIILACIGIILIITSNFIHCR